MAPGAVVVGTGFGSRVHVPALRAAGFTVEALVGTDPDRTARRADRLGIPNALTSFDAALGLNPKLADSLYGRGIAKRKKGDPMGADADLAAAKAIRPGIAQEFALSEIE